MLEEQVLYNSNNKYQINTQWATKVIIFFDIKYINWI